MRIIFKILAAPFVLVLTLLVAVLSFLLSLSAGLLSISQLILDAPYTIDHTGRQFPAEHAG